MPKTYVSIHAPREGCDSETDTLEIQRLVSINAPRGGCDNPFETPYQLWRRFNSRTPGGVRLKSPRPSAKFDTFQFTHPGRGATGTSTP